MTTQQRKPIAHTPKEQLAFIKQYFGGFDESPLPIDYDLAMSKALDLSIEEMRDRFPKAWHDVEQAVNAHDALMAALEEITKPSGPYSLDRLTYAKNVIEHMAEVAEQAIKLASRE